MALVAALVDTAFVFKGRKRKVLRVLGAMNSLSFGFPFAPLFDCCRASYFVEDLLSVLSCVELYLRQKDDTGMGTRTMAIHILIS
jgi:hypothetical protein